jgi:hypothetical protein
MSLNWHSLVSHTRVDAPYSGPMESMKHAWSDERMDEFAERTEENFKEVRREIRGSRTELRGDIRNVDAELKKEMITLRGEMSERFAGIEERFNILFGALATGFVGAVVTHFIG